MILETKQSEVYTWKLKLQRKGIRSVGTIKSMFIDARTHGHGHLERPMKYQIIRRFHSNSGWAVQGFVSTTDMDSRRQAGGSSVPHRVSVPMNNWLVDAVVDCSRCRGRRFVPPQRCNYWSCRYSTCQSPNRLSLELDVFITLKSVTNRLLLWSNTSARYRWIPVWLYSLTNITL